MRKWLSLILMVGLVVLTACGTDEETETQANDSEQEQTTDVASLADNLTAESEVETENKKANISFSLTNEGEEAVELGFASGQQFDIHITDENGENVYTYSADRSFTQEQTTKELEAGGMMENAAMWEENVEPGEYEAIVSFPVDTINGEDVSDRDFESTTSFTIEASKESGNETNGESDSGEETNNNTENEDTTGKESSDQSEETTSIEGNDAFRNLELSGENGEYTVSGEARVFEGTFLYRVEDGHNELVPETPVQVDSGAPSWSSFELDISIPESDLPDFGTLTLMLYENSAKDGEPTNINYVPLEQFGGE
ncbi:BsuPI-related putative proteinase inhibitor [Salimicrobium flavidum]|uniref:Immunoglobulin-like domain of spore germination n=1 Tax=Salimicrobium flavidum TaxID=570947 RepID=A0A1N7JEA4_9BACI|nr:BsuPI-related putative proteinase inhibitor [Salimicrobium flavidum]SIS47685.1 Immunoglobulin-like domain of spore germination [Salimicrobium flavidum]